MGKIIINYVNEIKNKITFAQRFFILEYLMVLFLYLVYGYIILKTRDAIIIILSLIFLFYITVLKIYYENKTFQRNCDFFKKERVLLENIKKFLTEQKQYHLDLRTELEKQVKKNEMLIKRKTLRRK